jgi:hypothetical protein
MSDLDRDYLAAWSRVDEAVDEVRNNPNRGEWSDAELADGLAIAYSGHPRISKAAPGLLAVAVIRLADLADNMTEAQAAFGHLQNLVEELTRERDDALLDAARMREGGESVDR